MRNRLIFALGSNADMEALSGSSTTMSMPMGAPSSPGLVCDLAVLDRNYLAVPNKALLDTQSLQTIVGGRHVPGMGGQRVRQERRPRSERTEPKPSVAPSGFFLVEKDDAGSPEPFRRTYETLVIGIEVYL